MDFNARLFLDEPADVFFKDFSHFFKYDTFDVWRRPLPSSGLFEYKVRGVFTGIPASSLLSVYLDFDYRKSWDPVIKQGDILDDKPSVAADSAVETTFPSLIEQRLRYLTLSHQTPRTYYYAIKMPFPLVTRDYVYTVRAWEDGEKGDYCVEGKSSVHPDRPPQKQSVAIRIDDYYQQICVRQVESGAMLAMRYHDNPKGSIPPMVINYAAQQGVPSFVKGLSDAATNYEKWLGRGQAS